MSTSTLRLLLPSLLLASTLVACGEKAADASADGSAPRSKSFNVTVKAKDADSDEEEIKRFRLTIDGVRKMHVINVAMEKLDLEKSSEAKGTAEDSAAAEREDENDTAGGSNSSSLDEIETFLNANAQARTLLASHGMDTRDYVVMTHAMIVVGVAQMMIDSGVRPDSVAKEMKVSAANMQFYKEHRTELDAMQKMSKPKKS